MAADYDIIIIGTGAGGSNSGGDNRPQTIAGRMFSGLNSLKKVGACRRRHIQRFLLIKALSILVIWFPIIKEVTFG